MLNFFKTLLSEWKPIMANIVCKKWFLFQVEIKKKKSTEIVAYVCQQILTTNQAALDKLTIPILINYLGSKIIMTWLFKMKIETTAHAAADAICNFSNMQRYFIKKSVYTFGVQGLISFLISSTMCDKTVQLRISYSHEFFFFKYCKMSDKKYLFLLTCSR